MDLLKVEKQQAYRFVQVARTSRVSMQRDVSLSLFRRLLDIIGLTFQGDPLIEKKTRLDIKQRVHKKVFLLKGAIAASAAAAAAAATAAAADASAADSIPPQVATPPPKPPLKK